MGPISYLIVEFPGNKMTGEGFPLLVDLVDRGIIRILDLMFVTRETDGTMRALELRDIDHDGQLDLTVFEGASSGLLDDSDLADAAPVIEPGSSAGILIFENRWATAVHAGAPAGRRGARRRRIHPPGRRGRRRSTPPTADQTREDTIMPGLLRGVARTAVVAGTATAVSNRVSRRQANKWSQQEDAAVRTAAAVQPAAAGTGAGAGRPRPT